MASPSKNILFITDYPNMILFSQCAILQVKDKMGNSVSFNLGLKKDKFSQNTVLK